MRTASAIGLVALGVAALAADPVARPWLRDGGAPGEVSAPAPSGEEARGAGEDDSPEPDASEAAEAMDLEARRAALSVLEADIAAKLQELEKLEKLALETIDERAAAQTAAEAETGPEPADLRKVVSLYESMKPKKAALLLENLPLATATRVLRAMKARPAGKILNEMDPKLGARISKQIAEPGG